MRLTFLGTGTSYGVPYIGCGCAVCRSTDPHNKRLRCSILVEGKEPTGSGLPVRLLVDTTPDLRCQLLRSNLSSVSAVLWTHTHNDHIIGLDDIRPLCDQSGYIDGYGSEATLTHLKKVFDYIFIPGREHGGFPRMNERVIAPFESFSVGDIKVTPIPIMHGQREILAYRFECGGRSLVYATDCSGIPDESWEVMQNSNMLVIDALRFKLHPTHFNIEQALQAIARLQPRRAFLTHIAHDLDHNKTNNSLPSGIELAYDNLSLEV
jgi:phosphoribosyl 1,2-cyclic phosphate phosphodiesterase